MRVSWHDFRQACRKLLSSEDCQTLAAAWRALDNNLSGWLSLREFDRATYELTKFLTWIDTTFGSMLGAFPKLGGSCKDSTAQEQIGVTQSDFRYVCKNSGLGDAIAVKIFAGLDIDATGSISMDEIRFLNSWKVSNDLKEEEAWASLTRPKIVAAPLSPRKSFHKSLSMSLGQRLKS